MRRHPWLTAAIVLFVLCVGTFFAFEWHSEKRWQRYAAEARAHGVKLMITDFMQPPITDNANFASLPMLQKMFADPNAEIPLSLPRKKDAKQVTVGNFTSTLDSLPKFGDPLKSQPIDWQQWQQYFWEAGYLPEKSDDSVRDVLRALEHYAPEFQQWSEWRTRTQCRFPMDWSKAKMPSPHHFTVMRNAAKLFALRMRAHLALHDSRAAYADFQDGLQAYRALRHEPTLIDGLVRNSVLHILFAAVGDGCKDHAWTDEDSGKIEADLASIQAWDDCKFALASERGHFNNTMETWLRASMRERGEMFSAYADLGFEAPSKTQLWVAGMYPRAMVRDNQYWQNRYFDELLGRIDTDRQTIHLDRATPSAIGPPTDSFDAFHYFPIRSSQGAYAEVERRYITLQTMLDQTRLACALERFRAKHGAYPVALAELVPDFIAAAPNDVYASAPYRYRRIGETSFQLYGVGKNRKDDGGFIAPRLPENQQLDAIWLYAPSR